MKVLQRAVLSLLSVASVIICNTEGFILIAVISSFVFLSVYLSAVEYSILFLAVYASWRALLQKPNKAAASVTHSKQKQHNVKRSSEYISVECKTVA